MEGEGGAITWARSWFTPSILFLLLNLIIGTIVLTSKGIARAHRHHQQQYNHPEEEEEEHRAPYISRSTSSLLTRLRSIGSFSRYTSGDIPSESTPPPPLPETHPDPPEYEGRAHRHHRHQYNHLEEEEEEHRAPYISRSTSSLLTRLRSIGSLSRYTSGGLPSESTPPPPPPPPETHPDPTDHEGGSVRYHQFGRSQSETHPKAEAEEMEVAGRMHKSVSARSVADVADRRAGTADRAVEEVDARADDFINRFRDQLRLQRLESLLRYRDMLNRGR